MLRAPPSRTDRPPARSREARARRRVASASRAKRALAARLAPRRRGRVALVLLVVAGSLAFGPIVRSRVAKEGERRRVSR